MDEKVEKVREFPNLHGRKFSSTNQPTADERRMTTSVRKAMLDSFDVLGATAFLVAFVRKSDENARCYVNNLMRLLPIEVQASDSSLTVRVVTLMGEGVEVNFTREKKVPQDAAPLPALPAAGVDRDPAG